MSNDTRPKPASFGFDLDFEDLSSAKPASRAQTPKPVAPAPKAPQKAPAVFKPKSVNTTKPGKATPKSRPPAVLKERAEMADKLAKSMGFQSREQKPQILKKRRRTHHDEPVDQLSIRGPVRVLNTFITYCETKHLSYWEALEALLDERETD